MDVRAPGVVKLFGEHAVVYGKLAVAAAISLYSKASVRQTDSEKLSIILSDFNSFRYEFSNSELVALYREYMSNDDINAYTSAHIKIAEALPYATIAGALISEYDSIATGREVTISSEVPMQHGLASSSSCSTAFAVALLKANNEVLNSDKAIELARVGDIIVHKNRNAGRIDISTSYYGGIVSYSGKSGSVHESAKMDKALLIIDTGAKKPTSEMVAHVANQYKQNKQHIETILNQINECSVSGLNALKERDIDEVAKQMFKNHELLKELGVSTEKLDKVVELAKDNNAYGAKLSGGGGGGIAIAIAEADIVSKLNAIFTGHDFGVMISSVEANGAMQYNARFQ